MEDSAREIICATATSEGFSALDVIRISGKGSTGIVENLMRLAHGRLLGMRRKVGNIYDGETVLDEIVALSWPSGRSYTGEEMVEIICHGVPSSVSGIIDAVIDAGGRRAKPGEFTRRAYGNGRMSAIEVIALASRWRSGGEASEISGSAVKSCKDFMKRMETAHEILEGEIEFGEVRSDKGRNDLKTIFSDLVRTAEDFSSNAVILEGTGKVLIMGPMNSGKSTLLNLLAGRETAVVSEEPGTTRDGHSVSMSLMGRNMQLFDTAGHGGGGIDGCAYRIVMDNMDGSDRVVWMSENGEQEPPEEIVEKCLEVIRVASKSDLYEEQELEAGIRVSSVTGEGIEELKKRMASVPGSVSISGAARRILGRVREASGMIDGEDLVVASEMLGIAMEDLRSILGHGEKVSMSVERALSAMCVGK